MRAVGVSLLTNDSCPFYNLCLFVRHQLLITCQEQTFEINDINEMSILSCLIDTLYHQYWLNENLIIIFVAKLENKQFK